MIFDNIKNSKMYFGLKDGFKEAFEFIEKAVEEKYKKGKYEIDGEKVYAFVQEYATRTEDKAFFERHKNYIDIQYIIEGKEIMGVLDISKATVKEEYSEEKDAAFYENSNDVSFCIAKSGDFCVFYPHDIHAPGLAYNNMESDVKKIVVKIHI